MIRRIFSAIAALVGFGHAPRGREVPVPSLPKYSPHQHQPRGVLRSKPSRMWRFGRPVRHESNSKRREKREMYALGLSARQFRRLKRCKTDDQMKRLIARWRRHRLFPRAVAALS